MFKNIFFFYLLMTSFILCYSQNKEIINKDYKLILNYDKKKLAQIIQININKNNCDTFKYIVTWQKGEVVIECRQNGITTYRYKFDNKFRIYEYYLYSQWSNHETYEYLGKKIKKGEFINNSCLYYSLMYYEENISFDCFEDFFGIDIIKSELSSRRKYYKKGKKKIEYKYFFDLPLSYEKKEKYKSYLIE